MSELRFRMFGYSGVSGFVETVAICFEYVVDDQTVKLLFQVEE
jgi:hypothetical protein